MIESVRLHRFRNYDDEMITFPKAIILLYGKNGQGKTNLLESLYMGGIGKSYRGIADADLISWNQDQASIIIQFQRSDTQQQLKIILSRTAKKELWSMKQKFPKRNWSGPSTKSCSRRRLAAHQGQPVAAAPFHRHGNLPGQPAVLPGTAAVQPGHFPAQSPAEEDEI